MLTDSVVRTRARSLLNAWKRGDHGHLQQTLALRSNLGATASEQESMELLGAVEETFAAWLRSPDACEPVTLEVSVDVLETLSGHRRHLTC